MIKRTARFVDHARKQLVPHLVAVTVTALAATSAHTQDAAGILKAMSDYLASQKTISLSFDADIEIITPDIQKLQFTSSGELKLVRPDKIHATRTGGYADVELVFDGKTMSLLGKNINAFLQAELPGNIDQLIDRLRNEFGASIPGADLLFSKSYDELMLDVIDAKHIGRGVINGVECEHLAFRNPDNDWQIWVEVGNRPIPRKYVITSKTVTAAPQYTLRVREWSTNAIPTTAFEFRPPANAKKADAAILPQIDELPPGVVLGGKK